MRPVGGGWTGLDQNGAVTTRGEQTRAKLLRVTAQLVREVGYAQTTTRAVAQAAGVAEGTIYRHFPDKISLLFAAAVDQHAPIVRWMQELPDRAGQGEVADTLTDCLSRLAQLRESLLPLELAILSDPDLAAARRAFQPPDDTPDPPRLLWQYLAAEQGLGRLRPDVDPAEVSVLLLAALFGMALAPPDPHPELTAPTVRGFVELVLRGIGPTTSPTSTDGREI